MAEQRVDPLLKGKVALVAGATRGAGRAIAVELCRAGAFVYATGRSSRVSGPSDMDRPETIEETGELMLATGGAGSALCVDHLDVAAVGDLVARIEAERGRLDLLVNDIFGGHTYMQWDKKLWEHDLTGGLTMLRMGVHTHLITSAKALPLILRTGDGLVIGMTDGTSEYNQAFRRNVGFYYDLVKANVARIASGVGGGTRGGDVYGGGGDPWLDALGADAGGVWRDGGDLARGARATCRTSASRRRPPMWRGGL